MSILVNNPTLQDIKDAINSLDSSLSTMENDITSNISLKINSLSTNVENISIDLTALSTTVESISTDLTKLYSINSSNFSSNTSYRIGDYVLYDGLLYRFNSSHTAGAWNINEVVPVKLTDELLSKISDAPSDGDAYARKNGSWAIISGGGSGGIGLGDTITFDDDTAVITTGDRPITELYDMNSDNFSPATNYNVGDYTLYDGKLYKFISDHLAQPWDSTHVVNVNITDELLLKAPIDSPNLTGTPTAPTPSLEDNSTKLATTAFVVSHDPFWLTGTASAGNSYTLTDSRINSENWQLDNVIYGTPSNVTTRSGTWTTNITNHTLTLSVTFVGATTILAKMVYVQ